MATPTPLANYNLEDARLIKKEVEIPTILVGGVSKLAHIQSMIEDGAADFVAMARPFIMEPNIVHKFKIGQSGESRCIKCGYCLLGVSQGPLRCFHGHIPKKLKSTQKRSCPKFQE